MIDRTVTILDLMSDAALFGSWFKVPRHWTAWRAFLAALFCLPMTDEELLIFRAATGLEHPSKQALTEAWLIVGRRGGKSRVLALIAVYLALFLDWTANLAPGERGTILVIATDKRQARTIMRYVKGMIAGHAALASQIEREAAEEIDLKNRITIEITAASFRTTRGYTLIAGLCDEIAFWRSEDAANPDAEILDALRPAMATVEGGMLLCASSPYARRGALWDAYRRWFGKTTAPALVWKADTRTMNPTVPQRVVDDAYERDAASAAAEFGAEFRSDVETFVAREVIDAATAPGRYELPPMAGVVYRAHCDPSGGSVDSMTLAIAHREGNVAILDAVRERKPPFSPDGVVAEFAALLKTYGINEVTGDRYAGEWPRERFSVHGITYRPADKSTSEGYLELLPVLNAGRAELLDLPRLTAQLCGLERRTARGGRDSVDHAHGAHDDIAAAVSGAVVKTLALYAADPVKFAAPIIIRQSITIPGERPGGSRRPSFGRESRNFPFRT